MTHPGAPTARPFHSSTRQSAVLRVVFVAALFHVAYVTYLAPTWGYLGFALEPYTVRDAVVTYALALVPAFLVPLRTNRRSIVVFFVLYSLFYVPSEFCLLFAHGTWAGAPSIQYALAAGFGFVALSMRLPTISLRMPPLRWGTFVGVLVALCAASAALALSGGVSNLSFASFFDASAARRAKEEASGIFSLFGAGYVFAWVTYVVGPLLILVGLSRRRIGLFGVGLAAELLIYAATAAKFALLTPMFVVAAWFFCRKDGGRRTVKYIYWASGALFTTLLAGNAALGLPNRIEGVLTFFVMRYFGYQGLSTVLYARFAEAKGYTYWSHVKGVATYIRYPFDQALPWAVADFSLDFPGTSAPGHPWAQDGLIAAGLVGVLVISVVIALVFWATDTLTARARPDIVVPLMLIQGILLSESSLFTQLLSNGWLAFCVLLWVSPRSLRASAARRPSPPVTAAAGATAS